MKDFKGIYTALLTPFTKEDKINAKALEKLVKYNVDMGVAGFYVGGSTGEGLMLSTEERMEIMEIVKSTAPDKTLIAHIGSLSENQATALATHAKKLGYDAISSVTPFYYKFTFPEIRDYYYRLADAASLPMLVYYLPALSGVNLGVSEMSEFLGDERVLGIKFTSNDFFSLERCKTAFPDKILYNGYDEMFLSGKIMGADGAIGSTYNFMADKFVKIDNLFAEGKLEEAKALQSEANRIIAILCKYGVMHSEKEILNQLGFDFGTCRRPFKEISDEGKEAIKKEIIPFI